MRVLAILAATCVLLACGPPAAAQATPAPTLARTVGPTASAAPSPTPPPNAHVFVIVMENRSYDQAIAGAYTAQLAAKYAVATNYHGVSHPSLPNYLALTSGSTWGISDDGYHPLPSGGIGAQLTASGIDWRAYMEGMNGSCLRTAYPYALKHDPFPYYGNACPAQVVPFSQFDADMAGTIPRFVWITPNMCNDGHDCSTTVADKWLSLTVPKILATSAWKENGLLLITWDEGEDSANHVLTLVVHPDPLLHTSSSPYDHYSLLATIEDRLGVPRLGEAANATPLNDLTASVGSVTCRC
jgi:phospholipase C